MAVIDDHPLVLGAMSAVVSAMRDVAVDGFVDLASFDDAVANGAGYDLVLLDLGLPGFADLAALEYFREWYDDTPVVVLSATHDGATIRSALALGAMGFIPKTSPQPVLHRAIELVASGGVYVPPQAMQHAPVVSATRGAMNGASDEFSTRAYEDGEIAQRITALTPRQRDVLGQLLKGMSNKLICRQLGLSPNTVKSHVGAIFRALNVENRTQAVIAARKWELKVDLRRPVTRDLPR